ncbi:UDP-glucose/GDP-mannose dehydrogenase family protein [Candidatus Woesearchaeota archaeon]|nr:UDP-glucose/GDP-mannose dehydrogenase family protein [Candidatus Woesearchaeota archaeon]
MANIGIIGYGIVGQAIEHAFKDQNSILFYDKFKPSTPLKEVVEKSKFVFICLPTPFKNDKIDLSIIDENLKEITKLTDNTDKIIIIKSTVVPNTTKSYSKLYPKTKFCFSPEFLREANYLYDAINPDRIIIGADNLDVRKRVVDLFKKRFPNITIFETDPTTAETVKYMANCFLATKVIFANEIFDLCQKLRINYDEVKKMVIEDKRMGKTHFDVTKEFGFGGKCLPKDIIALMGLYKDLNVDSSLLETVWKKNLKIRKVKDWEEIPFVKSD